MTTGSCLCGAVKFEIDTAKVVISVGCCCSNCRKVSGSQYGVYLQVKQDGFRWMSGEDHVVAYESSPGNRRGFCRTCGAIAPITTSYGAVRVPGGALDDDPGITPGVLLFADSAANWCSVAETQQRFSDSGPPAFWGGVVQKLFGGA